MRGAAAAVFVVAAAITWNGARGMSGGMSMPGGWVMPMMWMRMPGQTAWGAAGMFLLMWQAMMIAMMLPSSWPMLELYQRVAVSSGEKRPGLSVAFAGAGYFGPFGIDGFRYRHEDGSERFNARCEINARLTMGYPRALLLAGLTRDMST